MTTPSRARPAQRRRARRRGLLAAGLLGLVGGVLFALGLGLGRALEENRKPGDSVTQVRTLRPLPLAPARETVTVTVTAP